MTMTEMMAGAMMNHGSMTVSTSSCPYPGTEVAVRINLLSVMRAKHSDEEVSTDYLSDDRHSVSTFPDEEDREAKMDAAAALFTNKEADKSQRAEYLPFAVRGGIYDQGGPAIGDLTRSERNRSRDAMGMHHAATMISAR